MNEIIPRKRKTNVGRIWTRRINGRIYPYSTFINGLFGIVSPSLFHLISENEYIEKAQTEGKKITDEINKCVKTAKIVQKDGLPYVSIVVDLDELDTLNKFHDELKKAVQNFWGEI